MPRIRGYQNLPEHGYKVVPALSPRDELVQRVHDLVRLRRQLRLERVRVPPPFRCHHIPPMFSNMILSGSRLTLPSKNRGDSRAPHTAVLQCLRFRFSVGLVQAYGGL